MRFLILHSHLYTLSARTAVICREVRKSVQNAVKRRMFTVELPDTTGRSVTGMKEKPRSLRTEK